MDDKATAYIDIRYVADLARIALTDEEIARYGPELDAILAYVEQLREIDVAGIEPMAHAVPRLNIMREDAVTECLDREQVMKNAPATVDDALIRVPVVIEGEEVSG